MMDIDVDVMRNICKKLESTDINDDENIIQYYINQEKIFLLFSLVGKRKSIK